MRPSGLNATLLSTVLVWPVSVAPIGWPVFALHSRTVSSSLPETRVCPSGLNATLVDAVGVPGERGADRSTSVGVPQPHGVVASSPRQGGARQG